MIRIEDALTIAHAIAFDSIVFQSNWIQWQLKFALFPINLPSYPVYFQYVIHSVLIITINLHFLCSFLFSARFSYLGKWMLLSFDWYCWHIQSVNEPTELLQFNGTETSHLEVNFLMKIFICGGIVRASITLTFVLI